MALLIRLYLLVGIRIIISQHWKLLLISTLMFLMLCSLGVWQVFRLDQKNTLILSLDQSLSSPPQSLNQFQNPKQFERVMVEGHFADTPPLLLKSKPFEGKVGQYVVSPFITNGGKWILILRGWTDQNVFSPPLETYTLKGQIRTVTPARWFEPDNTPNSWVRIDPEAMSKAINHSVTQFYILEDSPPPPFHILPHRPNLPNNHLAYIITWFSLAFALCVMVFLYIRKETRRARSNYNPR